MDEREPLNYSRDNDEGIDWTPRCPFGWPSDDEVGHWCELHANHDEPHRCDCGANHE